MQKRKRPHVRSAAQTETVHHQDSAQAAFVQTRERPVLFSGSMVRAILSGAKGQTRRVVRQSASPYGRRGDGLWVRETFASGYGLAEVDSPDHLNALPDARPAPRVIYRADGAVLPAGCSWRPSIFMPRPFSRLKLVIRETRVERLQTITPDDARAEGIDGSSTTPVDDFSALWDLINGSRPGCAWSANPLVHVITFEVERRVAGSSRGAL